MKRPGVRARATVWRGDERVGTLARDAAGGTFTYDEGYRGRGIAFRLPPDKAQFHTAGTNLHPFFAGLLPEGVRLRALEERVKTSPDDLLSLLAAAGESCIGDIAVTVGDVPPRDPDPELDLAQADFWQLFRASLAGEDEPTIPGVQEKISASVVSFTVKGRRGDHILKLNPERTPRIVENEHFFLRMAAACGLTVARAELVHDRTGAAGLLVERFDRITTGEKRTRIHQEDACQFLDRYPADKYAVSCNEIAGAIAELASAPAVALAELVRLVAFSYLIGNGDLHAKNVSLRDRDELVELTPAYDLLSTIPYGDRTMALRIDGRDDNLKRAGLVAFGERYGVRAKATLAMLDELCEVAPSFIARLGEIGLDARKTAHLARVMGKRRKDLAT